MVFILAGFRSMESLCGFLPPMPVQSGNPAKEIHQSNKEKRKPSGSPLSKLMV
jgi:hypothetical protein